MGDGGNETNFKNIKTIYSVDSMCILLTTEYAETG